MPRAEFTNDAAVARGAGAITQAKGESNLAFMRRMLEQGFYNQALKFADGLGKAERQKLFRNAAKRPEFATLLQTDTVLAAGGDIEGHTEAARLLGKKIGRFAGSAGSAGGTGDFGAFGDASGAGGGGGGGGFGGIPQPSKSAQRLAAMSSIGFAFPFDVTKYVDKAIRLGFSGADAGDMAYAMILKSKEFDRAFPGIKRADGTLKMNPGAYLERTEEMRSIAAEHGFGLSREQIGGLFRNDVSAAEFQTRARAAQLVRTNPDTFAALNEMITQYNRNAPSGSKVARLDNATAVINFATGKQDRVVYDLFESALFVSQARGAGVDITADEALSFARQTAGVVDAEQSEQAFREIASAAFLAGSELEAAGISRKDQLIVAFGGPDRGKIARRMEQVLKGRQAEIAQKRNPTTSPERQAVRQAGF